MSWSRTLVPLAGHYANPDVADLIEAVAALRKGVVMEQKIWTAAELDEMTPAERKKIFDDSIIWDLDDAPPELIERARAKILKRIAETEGKQSA